MKKTTIAFVCIVASFCLGCGSDSATQAGAPNMDGKTTVSPKADGGERKDGGGDFFESPVCVEHCGAGGSCSPGSTCEANRCVLKRKKPASCTEKQDCIPFTSLWVSPSAICTKVDECSIIEECVKVSGVGYCVRKPTKKNPNVCENRGKVKIKWPSITDTVVTVCGLDTADCENSVCVPACTEDKHCKRSSWPVCNKSTNRCVCGPSSCSSSKGAACMPSGDCGCTKNADCAQAGFDKCYSGVCGCENTDTCSDISEALNKPLFCEPL